MCGLWGGASTTLVGVEKEIIANLAMVSSLRGIHSTGIAVARKNHSRGGRASYEVLKEAEHPSIFVTHRDTQAAINKGQCHAVMGHNRWATIGMINRANSHPFEHRNIIGVHNGSIQGHRWNQHVPKDGTDSELLFKRIAEEGLEAALKEVAECDGHYAIVFMDMNRHTLNFIRNDRRPLWLATAKGGLLYWASEKWMLRGVCNREHGIELAEPELLPVHTLVSVDIGQHPHLRITPMPQVERKQTGWYGYGPSMFEDCDKNKKKQEPKMVPMTVAEVMAARALQEQKERDKIAGKKAHEMADKAIARLRLKYCERCQKDKEYCNCASYATTVKPGMGGSVPLVKNATMEMKAKAIITPKDAQEAGYYTFQGYGKTTWTLRAADDHLKEGCAHCKRPLILSDTVWWLNEETCVCTECADTSFIKNIIQSECNGQPHKGELLKHA